MTAYQPIERGDEFPMWAIYENPSDLPGMFVARKWRILRSGMAVATDEMIASTDIEPLRSRMIEAGLNRIPRLPQDDPVIVECWL